MKNYCPKLAAMRQVYPQVAHGLSRKQNPKLARLKITSVGTERNHVCALTVYAKWLLQGSGKHLKNATWSDSVSYLRHRSKLVKQKTLDLDRNAINMNFHFAKKLEYVLSQIVTLARDRAYTQKQLEFLISKASPGLALSIRLAANAGLRSMELLTIAPPLAMQDSDRDWHRGRFDGREVDVAYTVHGKGGLRREVRLKPELATVLNSHFRPAPATVSHRGAHVKSFFSVVGGHSFSLQFSRLSLKELGFSLGAHGLRYCFAQSRLLNLICAGHSPDESLKILAQELGHFAVSNTLTYLFQRFQADGSLVYGVAIAPSPVV